MKDEDIQKMVEYQHQPNSIELNRTTKGDYTWKIKVYYGQIFTRAINIIETIDEFLKKKYLKKE